MNQADIEKLLTIRTLQRDMLLWAASAYLEAWQKGSAKSIELAKHNLQKAVGIVEAELA